MNEYEKAAQTNLKVWARRLGVKPDSEKATEFLKREFRGSDTNDVKIRPLI